LLIEWGKYKKAKEMEETSAKKHVEFIFLNKIYLYGKRWQGR
jgi:hypothetical protein